MRFLHSSLSVFAATALLAPVPSALQGQDMDHSAHHGAAVQGAAMTCTPTGPVAERASAYDSASVSIDGAAAKVCYSRPSARGRTMIGGQYVPFGQAWRTGANEPTLIHLSAPAEIAGIRVEAGSYSLYTIPGESEWELFINASTTHWGNQLSPEVRAQDIGSARLPAQKVDEHVETFTIRFEAPSEGMTTMIMEWEHTKISVPMRLLGS